MKENAMKIVIVLIASVILGSCVKGDENMFGKQKFKLRPEQIKPIATGHGSCLATNMITIDGKPVNFMYREEPDNENDSGWRFFTGLEDDEYINNPKNTQIYDVNTIANYDKDIIPYLNSPIKTAYERNPQTGKIEQVLDFEFEE